MAEAHAGHEEHHVNYIKVYFILLVLLAISIVGPMFEIQVVTLITAFGIAGVKAYMVAKNFMHLDMSPKFITYIMVTCLVFMLLFFAGTSPDVMQSSGDNWTKNLDTWFYSPSVADHGHGDGGH